MVSNSIPFVRRTANRQHFVRCAALAVATLVLFVSCRSSLPWRDEQPAKEVNLAFTIENNLLFLSTVRINQQPGRYFFGSAQPRTVIDPRFAVHLHGRPHHLQLNNRQSVPFSPVWLSLEGVGDALIGADAWGASAVTIDYRSGLLTWQKDGMHPAYMTVYQFNAAPSILAEVDGRPVPVIVDTALPDTLVLPRGNARAGRSTARITIAGTDFGTVDVALGDVAAARIGNRLLSKFLVSVDYGRHQVGLWRDPRIPM